MQKFNHEILEKPLTLRTLGLVHAEEVSMIIHKSIIEAHK
jgi:hypothetical protein